jgi:hypothetical protein
MPRNGKRSQTAKKKCEGAHAAFGKDAAQITSPDTLEYHVLDDDSDAAVIYVDSTDDATSEEEVEASVEAVQHLYSVFIPSQLCLEHLEENTQEKCCKTTNRLPVYTESSQTTLWRKKATHKDAVKGCTTLDAFSCEEGVYLISSEQ